MSAQKLNAMIITKTKSDSIENETKMTKKYMKEIDAFEIKIKE